MFKNFVGVLAAVCICFIFVASATACNYTTSGGDRPVNGMTSYYVKCTDSGESYVVNFATYKKSQAYSDPFGGSHDSLSQAAVKVCRCN